ncbi:hypothetical protein F4802DRAFT_290365 [Xylaria palmicola]|nr:hypothetical protein F4802DRAFT_290365 [Xylaria palmicola]
MSQGPRFAELRRLVLGGDGLTRDEVRYLRFLLHDVQTDLVGELPLELLILVALQLDLDDFARCLRVSRVWRERFLSDPVTLAYARRQWPAMIGGAAQKYNFLDTLSRLNLLTRKIIEPNENDVEIVKWDSTTHYQLDPVLHSRPDTIPDDYARYTGHPESWVDLSPLYSHGKVAWHLCNCVIVVDDLRLRTRKVLTPPSGVQHGLNIELRSLGSRLVVGTIDRLLIAWDHTNNEVFEKQLPCRSLRCATHGDRIAIVLYGGDILIWTPGQPMLQLDMPPSKDEESMKPSISRVDVLFDPRDTKTLYLASASKYSLEPDDELHVEVHEFSEARHVASWSSACCLYPRGVDWFRYNDPFNDPPELYVAMFEYEFCRSGIFFSIRQIEGFSWPILVFDKLAREFIDFPEDEWWYPIVRRYQEYGWPGASGRFTAHPHSQGGLDLDFKVRFDPESYQVVRVQSTQKPSTSSEAS